MFQVGGSKFSFFISLNETMDPSNQSKKSFDVPIPFAHERKVGIDFSPTHHQRQSHPDETIEAQISTTWDAKLRAAPSLFNATKFRFAKYSKDVEEDVVTLHLGLTDYKTYIGTHMATHTFSPECQASPLGNVAVLETVDGFAPLLLRSRGIADCPGQMSFPGGHAEPSHLKPPLLEGDERVSALLAKATRDEVMEELFTNEAGIPPAHTFKLLGLVRRKPDGKVSMVYFARASVTSEQMLLDYRNGNVDQEESDLLHMVPMEVLPQLLDRDMSCLTELADGMLEQGQLEEKAALTAVPEMLGAIQLWKQMVDSKM